MVQFHTCLSRGRSDWDPFVRVLNDLGPISKKVVTVMAKCKPKGGKKKPK